MHRNITNLIRFCLDELLPPLVRDNKYFMYPLFYIWFKGKNIGTVMELKSLIHSWTDDDLARFYRELDSLARDRETDLNSACVDDILKTVDPNSRTLLDVGCGGGYLLRRISELNRYKLYGCDLLTHVDIKGEFRQGNVENLPFEDKSIDTVTCCHTLEHVRSVSRAVSELKRVAKRQLIVVVPRQKYYYYTLDEHINFFPIQASLQNAMGLKGGACRNLWGDWVYVADLSADNTPTPVSASYSEPHT